MSSTRKKIPLVGSRRVAQEMTTDGWYIDLEPQLYPTLYPRADPSLRLATQSSQAHFYLAVTLGGVEPEPEKPNFVDIGEPETGFALECRHRSLAF